MYIYADILIITNIYVDFLLIKSTQLLTHSPLRTFRAASASVFGSLFSLMIFLPQISAVLLAAIKLLSAAVIVLTAFGYGNRAAFMKRLLIFWLTSFIFAGLGTGFSYLTGGKMIVTGNGVIYADFSMAALVVTTIAAYAVIAVYRHFADCSEEGAVYTVIVSDNGRCTSFKALADTGNILKDSFTGKAVIVCGRNLLNSLYTEIPDETLLLSGSYVALKSKWRFIPYSTVAGRGLIPIICPSEICIKNDETGRFVQTDAYIGCTDSDTEFAVFNPKILL